MIKVIDKNNSARLYQWDQGREIAISTDADVVDFARKNDAKAVRVKPVVKDGVLTASIPNSLLQSNQQIVAYLVKGDQTIYGQVLPVIPRQKPADYVETEEDVLSYVALEKRVAELEKNAGGSGTGGISEETDPTVPDWAKQPTKPAYTAKEVGAMPEDTGKYKVIQDIMLEEDVGQVNISADADGKPFKLTKIRIKITGTVPVARLNVAISGMMNNYYYNAFNTNNKTTVIIEIGERIAPENVCTASQISGTDMDDALYGIVTSTTQRRDMMLRRTTDCADSMRFWLGVDSEFPAGTRIIVEGVVRNEEVG